jgi:Methyltransferase domain
MSFGERAALHGLLAQLRPVLSLEIGTYDGGSLEPIAAHSESVHTVDLHPLVPDAERFENVTFHVGDSREVLPELLSELADAGRTIDFALVDGDHSTEGVRADLMSLLGSEAAVETVILLHDTMNPGVRAGIEQAGVEAHGHVIYFEPDFVPGYEFRGGHFGGEVWGGLGLILTGAERPAGYAMSVRQTLYVEPFTARSHAAALADEAAALREQVAALRASLVDELAARRRLEASVSWRLTAPLRAAKRRMAR